MGADLARSVYITAMEPHSGKSVVALGMMETLVTRSRRVGFFRPIVAAGAEADAQIELIRRRYQLAEAYGEMHALTVEEASALIAGGHQDELKQRVFDAYKRIERECEVVVCEGTDFIGAAPALDFELNAALANTLGAPVLLVVRGVSTAQIAAAVRVARGSLAQRDCAYFGVIVNRVPPEALEDLRNHSVAYDRSEPMYVLAEDPELASPTVAEVAAALGAEVLLDAGTLRREVRDVRVAAMSVEHFIDDLVDGTLVIVPGDRADIVLACLAATLSAALPSIAGVVLTGGYALGASISRLLDGAPFPVLAVAERTYPTAAAVYGVAATITAEDDGKIASALGVFEAGIDPRELTERIELPRPARVTPMMFQYELIERAKVRRLRVVLPEGEDDRVLRAADILLRRQVVDLTILGAPEQVRARARALGRNLEEGQVVDPRH
jgi:phosphate acetyltransferase